MGNTHTKLLAGAFSVLSIAQFFMVSNLASEVNQYTENATASIVAAAPMRVRLMREQHRQYKSTLTERDLARMKHALKMHSAATTEETATDSTPTNRVIIKGPNGRQMVVPAYKLVKPSSEQSVDAVTAE